MTARVRELVLRLIPHESGVHHDNRQITHPRDAASILAPMLEHEAQEVFLILLLNAKNKVLAVSEVARGGFNTIEIDPRVIFRAALMCPRGPCTTIILAHNHPSGDPTPSPDDMDLTRRIIAGGTLLGIDVADHLVIGNGSFCSFKDTGRI